MIQFFVIVGLYSVLLTVIGYIVNNEVPKPYMDEIFHIPATQRYCEGNYTYWDPKITTLPGLYIFSVGLLQPLHFLSGAVGPFPSFCSVAALRSVNLLVGLVNLVLIQGLVRARHGAKEGFSEARGWLQTLNLSLLPPLAFITTLFYTDSLSLCLVLLTISLHSAHQDWLAALAGFLSLLARQSNIIWVFLAGAQAAGTLLLGEVRAEQVRTKQPPVIHLTVWGQAVELCQGIVSLVTSSPVRATVALGRLLVQTGGYILTGVAFLAFIHFNQGLVVGDRSAHQATLHIPQILYFSAFFTAFTAPLALLHLKDFTHWVRSNVIFVAVALFMLCMVVHFNTLAHPYLLADNRHFTFYIWRRLFMRHWSLKYLLVPAYIFSIYHICACLARAALMTKLLLPLCVLLSLIPQLLLEPRYFIIPFILIRLEVRPESLKALVFECIMLITVNLVTFYIFLFKPFEWEHEPGELQRFMW